MNSTQYSMDRRDIHFVQREFLRVDQLARLPDFKDFSPQDFSLTVEEGANFVEEVWAPLNKIGDEQGTVLKDGKVVTPRGFKDAWRKCSEAGWLGITADRKFGGQGLPVSVAVGVLEGLYGGNPALYVTTMLTAGAAGLIATFGSEEQKAAFCEKMIAGQWGGTMCLSEPNAGSAVGDITTAANKAPPGAGLEASGAPFGGHYLIKGSKCWISGGDHDFTENIVHLVLARVRGAPAGPKGISLFIVPKFRLDKSGNPAEPNDVTTVRLEHKLGIKGSPTCVLEFGAKDDCHGYLLEGENLGMNQMFKLMNEARFTVSYQGLGAASGAYRNALAYAQERVQGVSIEHGKDRAAKRAAIVQHPDVRNTLLTMKALTEGVRGLIYSLAFYTDMAHHGPEETRQHYQDLVDLLTPVAKNHGADQGFEVTRLGIQVLGGVGYSEEFPLAQAMRDAKIASIYEGTTGIQALDLVTRKLSMRNGGLLRSLAKEIGDLKPEQARDGGMKAAIYEWQDSLGKLLQTLNSLRQVGEELGPREAVLHATDVCMFFGDALCAYYLLKMGLLAEQKLAPLVNGMDPRTAAIQNPEARFYFNKIKTAEHYVFDILPRGKAVAAKVQARNFAALEAVLEA